MVVVSALAWPSNEEWIPSSGGRGRSGVAVRVGMAFLQSALIRAPPSLPSPDWAAKPLDECLALLLTLARLGEVACESASKLERDLIQRASSRAIREIWFFAIARSP
jgi:hypothetical protein